MSCVKSMLVIARVSETISKECAKGRESNKKNRKTKTKKSSADEQ